MKKQFLFFVSMLAAIVWGQAQNLCEAPTYVIEGEETSVYLGDTLIANIDLAAREVDQIAGEGVRVSIVEVQNGYIAIRCDFENCETLYVSDVEVLPPDKKDTKQKVTFSTSAGGNPG